jgi:hypothetical protein
MDSRLNGQEAQAPLSSMSQGGKRRSGFGLECEGAAEEMYFFHGLVLCRFESQNLPVRGAAKITLELMR